VFLEPGDGVSRLEAVERSHEILLSAWVALEEFTWVVAIVSDVATATAGDANFGEDLGSFFEDEDFLNSGLGGGDGSEESGGASADYDEVEYFVSHLGSRKP